MSHHWVDPIDIADYCCSSSVQKMYARSNAATYYNFMLPTDSAGSICGRDYPQFPYVYFPQAPLIVNCFRFSMRGYVLVIVL